MPINSIKVGPGEFTLGTTPLDVSCQVTSLSVNPSENVTTEEAVPVLCGDTLPSSDTVTYSFTVSGTFLQDLTTGGVVDYSWAHKGEEVPFSYTPNTALDASITGVCRPIPLTIGGEVSTRGTSDFEWVCIGDPVPSWAPAVP